MAHYKPPHLDLRCLQIQLCGVWIKILFEGIGAVVKKGETLALYQSVKTMMTITSPCDGVVSDIRTSESGQPVYTVKPHGDNQSTTAGQSSR